MNELLKSGTLLQNHYRILRVIDQGGMGAIYMAENRQLFNEVCAIKEMLDNFSSPEERKEGLHLFEQEAKILNTLRHPNLPRVQAYFNDNNRYYLVMDYIKGRTLDNIVESNSGFIPESAVMRWCADLCNILEYLHSQQPPIIFRDLNPRNIMLEDGTGDIKLIDFGIARFFKAGKSSDTISLGSPGYSPIEQYGRGQTDVRSEVYTLGATLYHLLTKKVSTPAIERIKPTPALLVPPRQINKKISPHVEQVILKALEINPDDRYQSIAELRNALFPQQMPAQTVKTQTGTTPNATKKTAPQARPHKPKAQTTKKQTTQSQTQKKTTQPPTGSTAKRRRGSPKFAWFVLLFVASMAIAEWVEGWQNRSSGGDETPRSAKSLTIPGSANDRVSFMDGDRTDWWELKIAQPGTLIVTITPRYKSDGIRLTVFDQSGENIIQKGNDQNTHIEAVIPVVKPTRILAQVMAPRIWDETGYIINVTTGKSAGIPLIARPDVENPIGPDDTEPGVLEIPDHPTPETAPDLTPETMVQGQVHIKNNGQGRSWWRIRAPTTGQMAIIVDSESAGYPSPTIEVYNEQKQAMAMSQDNDSNRLATVLMDNQYFIKLESDNHPEPIPYTILARFIEDGDVFSGEDGEPDGANEMPFEGSIQDSVSVGLGDQTDWWRLELPATGSVAVDFKADHPDGIRLHVYESDVIRRQKSIDNKNALAETNGNNQVRIDGPSGSAYYVAVTASNKAETGVYEIQTAFLLAPDANSGPDAEPSGAKPLSANRSTRDMVDYTRGDRTDWWRIAAPGPGTLTILLSGRNITTDLQLEVYDSNGTNLIEESKTAGFSREEITIPLTDRTTYLVKVFAETANDASEYQLMTWYAMEPNAKSGDDKAASGAMDLQLGRSINNSVDYNGGDQTDWWKLEVPSTGVLTITLEGEAFISNFNMNVYDHPDSTALASLHMFRKQQEQISIDIKQDGWYYIEILASHSSDKTQYSLSTSFEEE